MAAPFHNLSRTHGTMSHCSLAAWSPHRKVSCGKNNDGMVFCSNLFVKLPPPTKQCSMVAPQNADNLVTLFANPVQCRQSYTQNVCQDSVLPPRAFGCGSQHEAPIMKNWRKLWLACYSPHFTLLESACRALTDEPILKMSSQVSKTGLIHKVLGSTYGGLGYGYHKVMLKFFGHVHSAPRQLNHETECSNVTYKTLNDC